jgi:two-component system cell cycle sensor histidine kinase/response regulator CckA
LACQDSAARLECKKTACFPGAGANPADGSGQIPAAVASESEQRLIDRPKFDRSQSGARKAVKGKQIGLGVVAVLAPAVGGLVTAWLLPPAAAVWLLLLVLVLLALLAGWLVRRNLYLRQEEDNLREQVALLDLAHDAITMRDLQDRIVYWNKGAERLYGWTAAEALGRNAIELLFPGDSPRLTEARQILFRNGEWVGDWRQVTKAGQEIVAETRWTLVRDEQGQPKCILVVNTDVTERVQLQAQLLRTQRLESIGVLAGSVAHDFNNLLNPILMAVKLLREDRPEDERQHLLTTLQLSAERGAEIVRQLLSFAGGTDGERAPVQLRHLVSEVKSILDHTFPKTIRLEVAVADDLAPVFADATQLAQVLMNLCVNARDAMPSGGTLTIKAENVTVGREAARLHADARPGPHVRLTVADTGTGIAPEIIDRIFDPFFTTKEQGKGTGLGLSTVLGIVKSHGGFITLDSAPGKGSRFAVFLPALPQGEDGTAGSVRPAPPRGHGETILLVDDEPLLLDTVSAVLQGHGYRVVTAGNGKEALAAYQQERRQVQAVVLDMMMPVMDGPATLAALQELDPGVRVIATSGLRPTGWLVEALAAGRVHFLQKPYSDEQILATLARVLPAP